MRLDDHRNKSIHYFHSYAVQSRVDFSFLPNVHPDTCLHHPYEIARSLLPSTEDDRTLRLNFVTHISRILCSHMPFFKLSFDGMVEWHIKHKYYKQMSSKSVVVSFYYLKSILMILPTLYRCPWAFMKISWMKWLKSCLTYINMFLPKNTSERFSFKVQMVHIQAKYMTLIFTTYYLVEINSLQQEQEGPRDSR